VYFFTFHCRPKQGSTSAEVFAGAYINCWIHANDISTAEKIATFRINEIGWEILKKEEANHVNKAQYSSLSKAREYYEQALIDKWVLVVHGYHAN